MQAKNSCLVNLRKVPNLCSTRSSRSIISIFLLQTLREECKKLQMRVTDLEQQNKSLNNVFLNRLNERNQSAEVRSQMMAESRNRMFSPAHQVLIIMFHFSFPQKIPTLISAKPMLCDQDMNLL